MQLWGAEETRSEALKILTTKLPCFSPQKLSIFNTLTCACEELGLSDTQLHFIEGYRHLKHSWDTEKHTVIHNGQVYPLYFYNKDSFKAASV